MTPVAHSHFTRLHSHCSLFSFDTHCEAGLEDSPNHYHLVEYAIKFMIPLGIEMWVLKCQPITVNSLENVSRDQWTRVSQISYF